MTWDRDIQDFRGFLRLEKSLSEATEVAYLQDITHFRNFLVKEKETIEPAHVNIDHVRGFIALIHDLGLEPSTQSRMISGIRAFFDFLLMEESIMVNPATLVELPRLRRKLPIFLTTQEMEKMMGGADLTKAEEIRNWAMLEVLYSCGLRVSELINLKRSHIFYDDFFIRIVGKGNKERLVPIGKPALHAIRVYEEQVRQAMTIFETYRDTLFLNQRGKPLSRQYVFLFIRSWAQRCGIKKKIGPHSIRHSFATALIEGGADLRAIQQMLGHESVTTTEIYTHLDRQYLKDTLIQFHPRANVK